MAFKEGLFERFKVFKECIMAPMYEYSGVTFDDDYTEYEQRLIFFGNEILNLTTYDDSLTLSITKKIVNIMNVIYEKTNSDYIKVDSQYEDYILYVQFITRWLDWGTSIRGAWFDTYNGKIDIVDAVYPLNEENLDILIHFLRGENL